MLVGDGRRSPDACWPVREMWQRLVCRDKLENVACSSQSLQGLAKTPTGSCLPSLLIYLFLLHPLRLSCFLNFCLFVPLFPLPCSLLCSSFHASLVSIRLQILHTHIHVDLFKQFLLALVSSMHNVNIRPNPVPGLGSACSTSSHMHTSTHPHTTHT